MTNAESNFELAVKFIKGEGVEKDVDKATALLIKAAAAGHIKAQYNLGVMYLNGIGSEKNIDKATDYFNQAANQGHEQARHALEKICKTLSIKKIQTSIEAGVSPNPHEKSNECLACQSCNKNNLPTANFCINCGVKLQGNSESITRKPSNEHANAISIAANVSQQTISTDQTKNQEEKEAQIQIAAEKLVLWFFLWIFSAVALAFAYFGWNYVAAACSAMSVCAAWELKKKRQHFPTAFIGCFAFIFIYFMYAHFNSGADYLYERWQSVGNISSGVKTTLIDGALIKETKTAVGTCHIGWIKVEIIPFGIKPDFEPKKIFVFVFEKDGQTWVNYRGKDYLEFLSRAWINDGCGDFPNIN